MIASTITPARPPAVMTANSRFGAPANHIRPNSTTARVTVAPRSGYSMTRANISSATGTTGTMRCRHWWMTVYWITWTCAPETANATSAASTAWNEKNPSLNQPREPLTSEPIPGISTRTSRNRQTRVSVADIWRMRSSLIRRPIQNVTAPNATKIMWRENSAYTPLPVFGSYDVTEDAESTMTAPITVSTPVRASTRWNDASGRESQAVSAVLTTTNALSLRLRFGAACFFCSTTATRLPRRTVAKGTYRRGERVATFAVVAEHVQRRRGGREQHHVTGSRHRAGRIHRRSHRVIVTWTEAVHRDIRRVSRDRGGDHG